MGAISSRRRKGYQGVGKIWHVWELVRSLARLESRKLRKKRIETKLEG